MAKEPRPKGYPKLKNYKPSQFMLPTSHYDKKKADRAVTFIENLCHTKGKWAGTPFWLLPWQEQLIRDIFGIVKPDGSRQFRTAFVEICKKVGKSELAAAVALYLLYADNEPSAEVYGAAADRQQASIVFDVAKQMVEMSPALMKRSKLMGATKRIVNYSNAGYYQVLSAEVGGKHGFSVSGLVFDEIHTQPNRQLYDVLTKGSSDARQNPLHFIITTAGNGEVYRDAEYKRLGTLSLLAGIDLLTGEAIPLISETHKSSDFIEFLKILDKKYPAQDTIRIILDNHSAHTSKETCSFLDTMPKGRFKFVFTPKHGSWLNMIESFFSKMTKQMLRGIRVNSKQELADRIYQYFDEVNREPVVYHWKYKMDEISEEEAASV